MTRYLVKRLLELLPMLLIISIVAFILVRVVPVNPAEAYLSSHDIPITPESVAAINADLGLDKPLVTQYLLWLVDAVQLDFGTSYANRLDVLTQIGQAFWKTMELTVAALVWIALGSMGLAYISTRRPRGMVDQVSRVVTMLGAAVPSFVLGYFFVVVFSLKLGWFPVSGRGTPRHLFLPSITLAAAYVATYAQMLRNNMLLTSASRPVFYARARGVPGRVVDRTHILRASLLPVASSFGVSIGRLVAGSVLVENVFSWPGLGRLITEAVLSRDYPMVQGYIVCMAVVFILCNLGSDVVLAALDPRVRLNEGGSNA